MRDLLAYRKWWVLRRNTWFSVIHTYIIGQYNPTSVRIIELVSHTTYVVCVNFTHKWRDLQFKVDSERQFFEKLFMTYFIYSQSLPEICWGNKTTYFARAKSFVPIEQWNTNYIATILQWINRFEYPTVINEYLQILLHTYIYNWPLQPFQSGLRSSFSHHSCCG